MPDRGEVIKKLEECLSASCRGFRTCPYSDADWDAVREALALLREQEPQEPHYCEADDSWSCGNCGETVGYSEFNPGGIDPVRNKYCPECGRKVKWNA